MYKYNTGFFFFWGGGGLRLPYVYVGGAHEKKVGNHWYTVYGIYYLI